MLVEFFCALIGFGMAVYEYRQHHFQHPDIYIIPALMIFLFLVAFDQENNDWIKEHEEERYKELREYYRGPQS